MERKTAGLASLLAAILLVLGPQYLFPVCPAGEKIMKCFWTARAEIAAAIVLAVIGALQIARSANAGLRDLCLVSAAASAAAAALPAFLIGGCRMPQMACRASAFPAIYAVCAANIILQCFILWKLSQTTGKTE